MTELNNLNKSFEKLFWPLSKNKWKEAQFNFMEVIKITGTIKTLILEILTGQGPGHIQEIHLRVSEFRAEVPQHTVRARLSEMSRSRSLEEKLRAFGNGFYGWPDKAPFDAIIVTAAPEKIPQPLIDQLNVGGRMIIPVGDFFQELYLMRKTDSGIKKEKKLPVRFVPLQGEP